MQYIKQFLNIRLFNWSAGKEIDLKNYKRTQETPIGKGAYGFVYKVQKDDQYYAAKVSNSSAIDPKAYVRELEILLKIQHPAILPFEGYSLTDFSGEANPTILTKYAENGSLRHVLWLEQKSQALDNWNNTQKYITLYGIAKGMDFLHKKGYIHRDLKPENILLNSYLYPEICDFGLSKCYDPDNTSTLTADRGTTAYMAPEVFQGKKYDYSVDVFSYGFIMFEIVTGKELYPKNMTQFDIQNRVVNGIRPQFPKGLTINDQIVELIENCWSNDPSSRPSFEDIIEILEDEKVVSWFEVDDDDFEKYSSIVDNENNSSSAVNKITEEYLSNTTSSKIKRVNINESYEQFSRQKIVEYEDEISIYPPSQIVFLEEKCQKLVKLAEGGNSDMMVAVADSLIQGIHGFPKNIEIGVKFLKCATDMNNIEASEKYASMLIKGDMIPVNLQKAEQIVESLMKKKCPNAKKMWAQLELTKSQPDYQKVKNYLKESASDGNVEAMVLYAKLCLMKKEETQMEPNEEEANKCIKLAAESGNQEAKQMIDHFIKEREECDRRQKEEEDRKRKEEEDRKRKEEEDRKRKEEDQRRREEEEYRRRREEEEYRRRRDEEERRRREEEERRRREEEERRRREIEEQQRRDEIERRRMYFPSCNPNSNSIVDSLKSIGVDSSMQYRRCIANRNGIGNYSGTAQQNIHLLSLLKQGQLLRP